MQVLQNDLYARLCAHNAREMDKHAPRLLHRHAQRAHTKPGEQQKVAVMVSRIMHQVRRDQTENFNPLNMSIPNEGICQRRGWRSAHTQFHRSYSNKHTYTQTTGGAII